MLTDKMLANLKTEIFCADKMDGIDGSALIPVQLGGTLDLSKPPAYSIMDLGKMLLMSAKEGDTSKVHDLMSRGAPFTTDWLGTSPLHLASMNNHLQTCEVLIRAGMSKDARTKVDRTPLHFAVYEGHEEIVELLLFNKCDIEAKDMLKMTPLHWAVEKHHTKIVEMLLQQGADPSACSKFKKTPLSIAAENGYDDIFQLLEAAFRLRLENPDQVKTATDNLVQELEQQQQQQNVMHLESLDCDTFELESQSEENDNTTHKEDNFSQQIDSDEGMTLSDAIIHLQNVDDSKPMDTSALQILKDHGISMLPAEDTENTLITSALESGRKIVLSEGGKLVLNETKPKKVAVPIIQPATQQPLKVVKKQPITVPAKTLPWKSNKVIKIITAEEFKQICCGDITTLKKISPDYLNQNIMPVKLNSFKSSNVTVPSYKPRKTIPIRNKLGLPSSISITPENKPKQQTTFINLASDTEAYESDLEMSPIIQTFQIATSSIASPSTSTFSSPSAVLQNHLPLQSTGTTTVRTVVTNSASPVQQTTTMGLSEIERQLLELKKQTDELRKQLELSQKQNEEYKLRLEKLEKEKEVEKEERNRRMSLPL